MPFNGPHWRELESNQELTEELVYCVQCGTPFIRAEGRDCPSCTLAEQTEALREELEQLQEESTELEQALQELSARLSASLPAEDA